MSRGRRIVGIVGVTLGGLLLVPACSGDDTTGATTVTSFPEPTVTVGPTVEPPEAPTGASPWLVGDARPAIVAGPRGRLSASPIGEPRSIAGSTDVAFVVQNLTGATVAGHGLTATATDPADGAPHPGLLLAMTSTRLEPGQWGLAVVRFLGVPRLPAGTTYEVTFPDSDFLMSRAVDLEVSDFAQDADGGHVVRVTNTSTIALANPFTVAVYCFDGDRVTTTDVQLASAGPDGFTFQPGSGTQVRFVTDPTCTTELVGALSFRA